MMRGIGNGGLRQIAMRQPVHGAFAQGFAFGRAAGPAKGDRGVDAPGTDLFGEPVVLAGLYVDMDVFHVLSEPAKCRWHHVIEEILRQAEPHGGLACRSANRERGFVIQRDDTPGVGDESLARFGRHEAAIFAP